MMAAAPITEAEYKKAIELHCLSAGLTASEGEQDGVKRILLDPGGVTVRLEAGDILSSSTTTRQALRMLIADMRKAEAEEREAPPKAAPKREASRNLPATGKEQPEGFDMDDWRKKQARSYSAAGKQAPNAFSVSEEANKRGFCTQIIDSGRNKELVWGHVRVTDPRTGQFREDRVAHEKETFCLLKAWEDANAQAKWVKAGQPALIIGIADNSMPELNPEARVKGMPASLWLTMAVMRSWSFADRDAITKAERRAQLKMLNREWREDDEIKLETEEEQEVKDSIDRRQV